MKPLLCTRCSQQVTLVEHYVAYLDQGFAMVREEDRRRFGPLAEEAP